MGDTPAVKSNDSVAEVRARRHAVFLLEQGKNEAAIATNARFCALALSGGGIRSATFSLGVIQAITLSTKSTVAPGVAPTYANSLLSSIDYLSTVSGGGYVGSFLVSLFLPGRLQPAAPSDADAHAAEHAFKVLSVEPPGRIEADRPAAAADWVRFPLAWLRDNGRYLTPTGPGDLAYDIALAIRNWVAVQYVIGTIFVLAFAVLSVLRGPLWQLALTYDVRWLPQPPLSSPLSFEMWWSPTAYIPIAIFLLWACPAGLAYWWAGKRGAFLPSLAAWGTLALTVILWFLSRHDPVPQRASVALAFAGLLLLSLVFYFATLLVAAVRGESAAVAQRVHLTRWLRNALVLAVALTVLALLEALGQSIYLLVVRGGSVTALASSLGIAGVLTALVKRGVSFLTAPKAKGLVSRIPLMTLAGAAGVLIILCVALLWSVAFAWILWGGQMPDVERTTSTSMTFIVVSVCVLGLALLTGVFPSFINLSSLQTLYAARLTRAYLGASNGKRGGASRGGKDQSAAEPVQGDDVEMKDFVDPKSGLPTSLAPFHLINVTLNSTVDPAEQLVQRDRKGLPMAVSPPCYWIGGDRFGYRDAATGNIDATPSVGKWISTSGAAASTGLGRQTSLGLSLLLGAANVRLGTWWKCPGASKPSTTASWMARLGRFLFRTQSYLADELQARFFGLRRDWQYLSDGGHFENIALYEMLRPSRNVGFAFATDAGADRDYEFGDLAILIRLVRIDFGIELQVDAAAASDKVLGEVFGMPEEFRAWMCLPRTATAGLAATFSKRAVLLKASFPNKAPHCWIVLFKPAVPSDAAADVLEYALADPHYPQQTTADQFFDEAQWESYRKLGIDNGLKVLRPDILAALRTHTGTTLV